MQRIFLISAALAGLLAVILGAFGAHSLRPLITADNLIIWEKGVQYQVYHGLGIFLCYLFLREEPSAYVRNAGICFMLGIICFSGSLYLLATRNLTGIPVIIIGPLTPAGGFFFIAGWGLVLLQALKKN